MVSKIELDFLGSTGDLGAQNGTKVEVKIEPKSRTLQIPVFYAGRPPKARKRGTKTTSKWSLFLDRDKT